MVALSDITVELQILGFTLFGLWCQRGVAWRGEAWRGVAYIS